jgi:hypothetical protein
MRRPRHIRKRVVRRVFSDSAQYGVGSASFTGSHERNIACTPFEPIAGNAEFVQIPAWVTCMAGSAPRSPD